MIIAVDGPAAAGKGTVARGLARHFGLHFLDTGALYRRVGLALLQAQSGEDAATAARIAASLAARPYRDSDLRSEAVGAAASRVAAMPEVRAALLDYQRDFAGQKPGAVLDGRDIGTVVCPTADVKIFVTASPAVRARRRFNELLSLGQEASLTAIEDDIRQRDARDQSRAVAPLLPAADAIVLDTSELAIEAALAAAVRIVESAVRPSDR